MIWIFYHSLHIIISRLLCGLFLLQTAAAHALIKTDGMTVGDKTISVAISKPPERKQGATSSAPFVPSSILSLGGGAKELGP